MSEASEAREPDLILYFAWRYHVLDVSVEDDLQDAASRTVYAADDAQEAFSHLEVWTGGEMRSYTLGELYEIHRADNPSYDAPRPPWNPIARISIVSPTDEGREARYDSYESMEKAEQEAERLRRIVGADRVKLTAIKRP